MARIRKFKRVTIMVEGKDVLPAKLQRYHDVANYIQHLIITRKSMGLTIRPHTHHFPNGTYRYESHPNHIPLMWDHLTALFGKKATAAVINHLIEVGVVERLDHYDEGVHAYGYKIGAAYEGQQPRRVYLSTKWLDDAIKKVDHVSYKHWTKGYLHCKSWVGRVQNDTQRMFSILKSLPTGEDIKVVVDMLADGDFNFRVCDYGRFHSVYTCLARSLRSCISYQGVPLVNVDLANSQPLILGMVVLRSLASSDPNPPSPPLTAAPHCASPHPPLSPYPLLPIRRPNDEKVDHKVLEEQGDTNKEFLPRMGIPDDLKKYIEICQQGKLYEHLMRGMGWAEGKDAFKDKVWFHFLYGCNKSMERIETDEELAAMKPLVEFFRTEFPTIYDYMWERKKRNYKTLPCDMQRLESRMMIEGVCGRLKDEAPEAPIITIHDSIMTTPTYIETVTWFIYDEFAKHGVKPTLHAA